MRHTTRTLKGRTIVLRNRTLRGGAGRLMLGGFNVDFLAFLNAWITGCP